MSDERLPLRRFGWARRLVPRALHPWARMIRKRLTAPPLEEPLRSVHANTLVHPVRLRHLHALARRVVDERIPGAIVECGVADGGSAALLGHATASEGAARPLHLFDSWEGLPAATPEDGEGAEEWNGDVVGSLRRVHGVLRRLGVDPARVQVHRGWFEQTLPAARVGRVALLHVDADWHDSVALALERFVPELSPGGFVQVDDYDDFPGCRLAVDTFLARHPELRLETSISDGVSVRWLRAPPA